MIEVLIAAAEAGGELPDLPAPAQYGILAILVTALASGRFLVPRYVLDRERERADRLEEENRRLNEVIITVQGKTLPALEASSHAINNAHTLIAEFQRRQEIQHELDRERGLGDAAHRAQP